MQLDLHTIASCFASSSTENPLSITSRLKGSKVFEILTRLVATVDLVHSARLYNKGESSSDPIFACVGISQQLAMKVD